MHESPSAHGIGWSGSSQSLMNSSKSNPRTWPIRPFRSFVRWAISSSRSPGLREVPSPSLADRPARERISDPSATISLVHLSILISMSAGSIDCCLVKLAWSVQFRDRMGPRTLRCTRFPASCAKPSRTRGGHACWAGVKPFPVIRSTLKRDRSSDICTFVLPHAYPHASAICSRGLLPSIAAASSMTAVSMLCLAINLMAFTALSPVVVPAPAPRPSGGNTAFGFMYPPSIFTAVA